MHIDQNTLLLISYLSGSIPFGLIFSKIVMKADIRQHGSGNIGATNAVRLGGKWFGLLILICDALKGFFPIMLAKIYHPHHITTCLTLAIMGHIFPIWLKLKGGKGVATALGAILGYSIYLGLSVLICWIIVFAMFRISGLASIITAIALPIIAHYGLNLEFKDVAMLATVSVLIIIRHKSNIMRLMAGKEKKL
jgi:glycerol-3-phosphate acyltransferase PlsY